MANFSLMDDEDYENLFITQEPKGNIVSLEENDANSSVFEAKYSDISDAEEDDAIDRRLR